MNNDWNAIGAIGQWAGAIATFFAALIALSTARNAKESYSLDQRPYLAFENLEITVYKKANKVVVNNISQQDSIQIGAIFRNVGKTIAKYDVKIFKVIVDGVEASGEWKNSGGIVYPGLNSIFRNAIVPVDRTKKQLSGTLEYTVYFGRGSQSTTYISSKKLGFDIFLSDQDFHWKYVVLHEEEDEIVKSIWRKIGQYIRI